VRILLAGVPAVTDRGWLGYCTVSLFPLEDGWALFDTGHYSDRHLLLDALRKADVSPDDIRHVVLSHLHFDHSLNLPLFRNAQVHISRAELEYAGKILSGDALDPSIPDFWPSMLDHRRVNAVDDDFRLSPTKTLRVVPGHTPGSMAMFCDGTPRVAVCGDAIKNAWEAVTGRSGMPLAGAAAARSSIATILREATVVVPGHDVPFSMGAGGVEFLAPFRWKVDISLYPDGPGETVASVRRPAGPAGTPKGGTTRFRQEENVVEPGPDQGPDKKKEG
jgi:glyoxylase-like metal-dependent hydrolase (beta-lactamase superfamily II)